MKKLILSGVLAIGTMLAVQAQNVKFGVKGGLNISKLTDTDGSKALAGFHAGGLVNIGLGKTWAIQPELVYSTQGTKAERSVLWLTSSNTVKVNYINVPVMVQYSIVPEFYLEAGPQVGFLTAAKVKSGDVTVDIKDNMQSVDFGLGFGFGYKFDMGLGVSGRYNFGLTKVYDSDQVDSKNSVAQVGVFFTF
ncbi:porin family protein [Chitinophaga polysaccharea]|uniref:porin family protein n=1 Tax=Chitinophaga polysaccharea TaxID=1293035 RepID=UPI001157572B|nr:porin family protein [Chitinophaga polysaccharea]